MQYVSSTPATRLDVINLQERLDQQLQQRQARETGICPVREELYAQVHSLEGLRGPVYERLGSVPNIREGVECRSECGKDICCSCLKSLNSLPGLV